MAEDFYCDEVLSGKAEISTVLETECVVAYHHTKPFWEVHIVVIPKRHISSLITMTADDNDMLTKIFEVVRKVAEDVVRDRGAARVLTNLGDYQESKHLHFHVYSGNRLRPDSII